MDVIGYACTQLCLVGWEWKLAVMQIVITLGACWIRTWGHGVESSLRWRKLFNLKNKLPSLYQRQNQSYFRWQTNQRADLWNLDQFLSTDKVHIFWEGHKILQNFHLTFVLRSASQMQGEDFPKFCGLLRIYELYHKSTSTFLTTLSRLHIMFVAKKVS